MSLINLVLNRPGTGWRPDSIDSRDLKLAALGLPEGVPTDATVLTKPIVIKNQRSTGSCVGQSVAQAVRIAFQVGDSKPTPDLSALFAYFNARKEGGEPIVDDGTQIRNAIKAVQKLGVCDETLWPFGVLKVNRMPAWSAFRGAHDRRGIRGYYRIADGDLASIRRALANRCPVVAGWSVNATFQAYRGVGTIGAMSAPYVGGHAMVIGAYSASTWTIVNSWGTEWGARGLATVDDSFIAQARDVWAINT